MKKMNRMIILIVLLIQIIGTFQIDIPCATPCISTNTCQLSECDRTQGVCVTSTRLPLPSNCCTENRHCTTSDLCVYSYCNLTSNSCEMTPICEENNIPKQVCTTDSQCRNTDTCTQTKCVDNVCQVSPLVNTNDPNCCKVTSDCPDSPCSEKFCNVETFRCFYTTIKGCNAISQSYLVAVDPNYNESSGYSYQTPDPTAGDVVGAVFGFLIIGFMGLALFLVLAILLLNIIVKKLFNKGDKDSADQPMVPSA